MSQEQFSTRIWLSQPHFEPSDIQYISSLFERSGMAMAYQNVPIFEKKLAAKLGQNVVALSSCTAAIHLAIKALNVEKNDTVICSTFTFAASANPILYEGAIPVFVDSELDTWNMSPEYLEQAIETQIRNGQKPKAVIVVHAYGVPAQIERICEICNHYQIPVIEDAAEALGASYKGKELGTWGEIGVYSFNNNKVISTGGGGALTTRDTQLAEKVRYWASQSRETGLPYYQHEAVGYNYRMGTMAAALGIGQLDVLEKRVAQRREIFNFYQENLGSKLLHWQPELAENSYASRWLSSAIIANKKVNNFALYSFLASNGIESRFLWKPLHLQPSLKQYAFYGQNIAEELFNSGISLPSGNDLQSSDLKYVSQITSKLLL